MKIKKEAYEIWKEYERGISYNTGIDLYENVERNNNFFNDRQWEGVNAPDLDKPVFNFLKPVVNYYTAMLISDDIATNVELANNLDAPKKKKKAAKQPTADGATDGKPETSLDDKIPKIIAQEVDNIIERTNMKFKNRRMIRNCAIDGDGCFYIWFDPDAETGFKYKGEIKVDLADNTNVLFGNPSEPDVQEQPFILIAYRRLTEDVKDEARLNGLSASEVVPDNESYYVNTERDTDNDYTTVLLKMWKEKGTVHIIKCTRNTIIKKEADTEYKLYPLAWMSWESMKNCYHGVSPLTGKIQNQIFVNKLYAMAMMYTTKMAFPKMLYDRTKIPAWDNRIGKAIGVAGNPNEALFANFQSADMSSNVMNMVQSTISQTKEMMGASDAALGNVKPDNTSAIIAVQKASSMPLDIQRMDFYNFVESCVRIFIEIMRVNYGVRKVTLTNSEGVTEQEEFDFSKLDHYALNLKIDIGQGSYWSELMQVQTLDNMMKSKIIPDALTYLEAVPEGYVKNKNKIIESIRRTQGAGLGDMPGLPGAANAPMPGGAKGGMPGLPGATKAPAPGGAPEPMGDMPDFSKMSKEELETFIDEMEGKPGAAKASIPGGAKGEMPGLPGATKAPAPGGAPEPMGDMPDFSKMSKEELAAFIDEMEGKEGKISQEDIEQIIEELKTLPPEAAVEVIERLPVSEEEKRRIAEALEASARKG